VHDQKRGATPSIAIWRDVGRGLKGMTDMSCALMANGGGATNSMCRPRRLTTIDTMLPFAPGGSPPRRAPPKFLLSPREQAREQIDRPPGGLVAMMRTVWRPGLLRGCGERQSARPLRDQYAKRGLQSQEIP